MMRKVHTEGWLGSRMEPGYGGSQVDTVWKLLLRCMLN